MASVRDIVTGAARLINAVGQGVPLPPGDAADGLKAFNDMVDSWNTMSLTIYTKNFTSYTLVSGKPSYTIGPSGDISVSPQERPVSIDRALVRVLTATPHIELPLSMLTDKEWADINVKTLTSTLPTKFYSTGDVPDMRLYLWPIPIDPNELVLWTWNRLSSTNTLNTDLELPPGYARALRYNLAIELASEYGLVPSPMVVQIANDSLAAIKRINSDPNFLECDPALLSPPAAFNWLTGK